MIVIVAPGQGSQKPGFLEPWLALPGVRDRVADWSETISVDLITHGTTSDQETIRDTAIAQPLIVAAGLLTGRLVLETLGGSRAVSFAGHSVGEFTAAALAGVITDEDAMVLVAERGRAMAESAGRVETGMSAVIGGLVEEVSAELTARGLFPANVNSAGQVVAAGEKNLLAELAENPPQGTRIIPLDVAGAFHTPFMASAVDRLAQAAGLVRFSTPHSPLYTNKDGSIVLDGDTVRDLLIGQVSSPVRWDLCMGGFARDGVSELIELAPAGALAGLAKRALPGVTTVKIDLPLHLETLTS